MEASLKFHPRHEGGTSGPDLSTWNRYWTCGRVHPLPAADSVLQTLGQAAGDYRSAPRLVASCKGIICAAALLVAAVPISNGAQHIERTGQPIDPAVVAQKPHGDRLGPTIGVKLDRYCISRGGVNRYGYIEENGLRISRMPAGHQIHHRVVVVWHDQLADHKIAAGIVFSIPESIPQSVFVTNIRAGWEAHADGVAVIGLDGELRHAGGKGCHPAREVRERVSQLDQIPGQPYRDPGNGVLRDDDGEGNLNLSSPHEPQGSWCRSAFCHDGALLVGMMATIQCVGHQVVGAWG